MTNLKDEIHSIINNFIDYSEDLVFSKDANYTISIVDDIYNAVLADDETYALEMLNSNNDLYGLFYVNTKNELILFVKNTDFVNFTGTLLHEVVHLVDFINLADSRNVYDFRTLQEDTFYILWSEFHAEYKVYRFLIEMGKSCIDPIRVSDEIKNSLINYYASPKLILQEATDFTIRKYGQYMALKTHFELLPKNPMKFYLNQEFLNLYDFLYDHRNFDNIENDYNDLVSIFKMLE